MLVIYLTALVFIISVIALIWIARKLKKFDKEGNYKSDRILKAMDYLEEVSIEVGLMDKPNN